MIRWALTARSSPRFSFSRAQGSQDGAVRGDRVSPKRERPGECAKRSSSSTPVAQSAPQDRRRRQPSRGRDDGPAYRSDPASVRRIFNNGSWQEDGRLFDGFWETMRRPDRFRLMRICTRAHPEGERIANVDFSHLFPRLAYQLCKREAPQGDLYDILGEGTAATASRSS